MSPERKRTKQSWNSALARCHNPSNPRFKHYGGRGIFVCDRWRQSFDAFLADMGERPVGLTLDRIDNNKGYEPGNCRWATVAQQNRNRRPHSSNLIYKGKDVTGQRFGRLVVVAYAHSKKRSNGKGVAVWSCKCDCGGEKIVSGYQLRAGRVRSCGCLWQENLKALPQISVNFRASRRT